MTVRGYSDSQAADHFVQGPPVEKEFVEYAKWLRYEPHKIGGLIDQEGRLDEPLIPEFPLKVYAFSYPAVPTPLNRHETLEIFIPVEGEGSYQMGNEVYPFRTGDIVIVDNLRPHCIVRSSTPNLRAVVVAFTPDLVYDLGATLATFVFLRPFRDGSRRTLPVAHPTDEKSALVCAALRGLIDAYFNRTDDPLLRQAGCKTYLLELLYLTADMFTSVGMDSPKCQPQRDIRELAELIDYLQTHHAEKIDVGLASGIARMSESTFMRHFKEATGMTFVSYLTQLRLNHALRLLRESRLPIGEIAAATGFTDQSYFDKKFRRHFAKSPREIRRQLLPLRGESAMS